MRSICTRRGWQVARWAKLISARRWNRRRRLIRDLVSMLLLTLHRGEGGYFYPRPIRTSPPPPPPSPPPPLPPPRGPIPRIFTRGGSFFKKRGIVLFSNTFPTGGKGNLFSWPIFDWFIEIQLIYLKHSSSPYNLNIGFFFFFFYCYCKTNARFILYLLAKFRIFFFLNFLMI